MFALGALGAMLGTRFLLADEMPIHEEYRRRVIAATETDAEWYSDLYELGWPDTTHRAIHNSTAEMWEAAGRPEIHWCDCGHYSAVGYLLPGIRQTVDFFAGR